MKFVVVASLLLHALSTSLRPAPSLAESCPTGIQRGCGNETISWPWSGGQLVGCKSTVYVTKHEPSEAIEGRPASASLKGKSISEPHACHSRVNATVSVLRLLLTQD